jgi:hypothetical protein
MLIGLIFIVLLIALWKSADHGTVAYVQTQVIAQGEDPASVPKHSNGCLWAFLCVLVIVVVGYLVMISNALVVTPQ